MNADSTLDDILYKVIYSRKAMLINHHDTQVAGKASSALDNAQEIHHLAQFFSSRLADW